ncbi:hypothetical protein [Methylobacterium oryzae]|uniref:hypothetical protein n=1 Tax=Methylobacterium oryzae TaxID=334852 RepID=UPI002F35DC0A
MREFENPDRWDKVAEHYGPRHYAAARDEPGPARRRQPSGLPGNPADRARDAQSCISRHHIRVTRPRDMCRRRPPHVFDALHNLPEKRYV